MIKICIDRNYSYPDLKRQSPGGTGIWDDIEIIESPLNDADFLVVLNKPSKDIQIKINQGGRLLFLQEPPYKKNEYFKYHFRFADQTISGFDNLKNNIQTQASLPWHVNKTYDELKTLSHSDLDKKNKISWITSNNNFYEGHHERIAFIDFLKEKKFDFDLYGRGFQPIEDKFTGLAPYKYSIAVENYFAQDYWTEKAIDCMLSWTTPIYFGCSNFDKYFPKGSFIWLDIRNKKEAFQKLQEILQSNHWEENIHQLEEARNLILDKYQLFPSVKNLVNQYYLNNHAPSKKNYFIPASGLTRIERIKKKLDHFSNRLRMNKII